LKTCRLSKKSALLGMPYGVARNRMVKALLFHMAGRCRMLDCYRCGKSIDSQETFSIEHKQAWMLAPDPLVAYFALENLAFSHLACNSSDGARLAALLSRKTVCPEGHSLTLENTIYKKRRGAQPSRGCRRCKKEVDAKRDRIKTARGEAISLARRQAQALRDAGHTVHGFRSTYNKGCRCEACRESNRLYRIELLERKRASSSIWRAPALQAGGTRSEAGEVHHSKPLSDNGESPAFSARSFRFESG
jgi:hypothetical protein